MAMVLTNFRWNCTPSLWAEEPPHALPCFLSHPNDHDNRSFSSSSALAASARAPAWERLAEPESTPESRCGLWSSSDSSPDFGERCRDCRPSSDAAAPWQPGQRRVDRFPAIRYAVIAAKSPIDPPGGNLRARRSDCRRYENVPTGWHPSPAPPAIDK